MTLLDTQPPAARRASADMRERPESAEAARLYEAYADQLLGFCTRRLRSRTEAEDAVQLTFLYALRALQRGVVPESESAWLHTIAVNICRWQQRTHSRRGPLASELDLDLIASEAPAEGDQRGLCRDLKEALRTLPSAQRRALVLREWHGLPSHEVAARLGLSASATYALLTRARRSFVLAFDARREGAFAVQLATLLHQFRGQLKAFFGAAPAKVAAVATVAAVGVSGVAVERSLHDDRSPSRPVPEGPVVSGDAASVATPSVAGGDRTAEQPATTPSARSGRMIAPAGGTSVAVVVPPRSPRSPRDPARDPAPVPAPAPADDPSVPEPPATPEPGQPLPSLPVDPPDPPDSPEIDLPTDLLPPVELLPLPPVELPPLPPVDVPPVDLPPVDLPPLPPLP